MISIRSIRFNLMKHRFWDRAFGNEQTWLKRRFDCILGDHFWKDVHRAVRPDYWIVDHQTCTRCDATRPPPPRER